MCASSRSHRLTNKNGTDKGLHLYLSNALLLSVEVVASAKAYHSRVGKGGKQYDIVRQSRAIDKGRFMIVRHNGQKGR